MRATAGLRTAGAQAAGRAGDIGGDPGDVAGAVRWLVSDEAAWGTGADLLVDGVRGARRGGHPRTPSTRC
ncbi:hypothetical protein [Streptomyces sp. NBC_00829]|uniref:hypothetical protein n=1 Tax=Streptomyces sp. NBC_00829 TaxID=2903679 RepID=UPI00386D644B